MQLQDVERGKLSEGGWGEKEKEESVCQLTSFSPGWFFGGGGEFWGRDKDRRISGLVYTGAI